MKRLPNFEHKKLASVATKDFKAEVALIVEELGNRLNKLLEKHAECLLKASFGGAQGDHHKDLWQIEDLEPDTTLPMDVMDSVNSIAPIGSEHCTEVISLPGRIEGPPQPPDVTEVELSKSSTEYTKKERIKKLSTKASLRTSVTMVTNEVTGKAIWIEEHTDVQKAAIKKYQNSFKLRAVEKSPGVHRSILRRRGRQAHITLMKSVTAILPTTSAEPEPICSTLHPAGQTRTIWNLISLLLICIDALTVPLLAFEIGDEGPWEVLAWFCTLFWTADMIVSFRTGFFVEAKVELRSGMIAKHYTMTWFFFDLLIVVFEWFSRFYTSFAPQGVVRTTRIVRSFRLVKLLRITKLTGLLTEVSHRLNSNMVSLFMDVFLLSTLMCAVCHLVTCVWYALGKNTSDGWTHKDPYAIEQGPDEMSFVYWYLSSARWVISQVNGRTDMDDRRNLPERGFTVIAGVLLSVVARSVFVALITKSVLQLSDIHRKRKDRRRSVNDYLRIHPVPATMERSVKAHALAYTDMDAEKQREGIVLALLPKHLQSNLVYEARKPLLEKHPLFSVFMHGFEVDARLMCFDVVKLWHAVKEEKIFQFKDPCSRMLILDTGTLLYGLDIDMKASIWTHDTVENGFGIANTAGSAPRIFQEASAVIRITHGMWVSEPAIWAIWSNKGTLTTENNCCMLEVDAMVFCSALQEYLDLFGLAVVYARQLLAALKQEDILSDYLSFNLVGGSDNPN